MTEPWRAAGGVDKFPEEIGRVRVCVTGGGGAETGIDADEESDEVRGEVVDEVVWEVGVIGGWTVACGSFAFLGDRRARGRRFCSGHCARRGAAFGGYG